MIQVQLKEIEHRLGIESFDKTPLKRALDRLPGVGPNGPWVAGGAVRRFVAGDKLDSDFDFFFKNEDQMRDFTEGLVFRGAVLKTKGEFNSTFILPATRIFETEEDEVGRYEPELTIQVIHFKFYSCPEQVIESFDYTLAQFLFDGGWFWMGDFALWDVARKKLVPTKLTFATSSLRRMLKYTRQGYTICQGGLADILKQVAENPNIVQDKVVYID